VLVVWQLDRLGRSLPHLIETVTALSKRGVGFRSLTEATDATTPGGRPIIHIFGALGQFEHDLIQERTRAGLAAAAARGRKSGRKPVMTEEKLKRAHAMVGKGLTVREIRDTAEGRENRALRGSQGRTRLVARRLIAIRSPTCIFIFLHLSLCLFYSKSAEVTSLLYVHSCSLPAMLSRLRSVFYDGPFGLDTGHGRHPFDGCLCRPVRGGIAACLTCCSARSSPPAC
jgi:hypothetical protein